MKITLTLPVSDQFLRDILCTACEGGSNYWANFRCTERLGDEWQRVKVKDVEEGNLGTFDITLTKLTAGIQILLTAKVGDTMPDGKLRESHFTVADSIKATVYESLASLDAGNIDSNEADCILQYACFGGIVYG